MCTCMSFLYCAKGVNVCSVFYSKLVFDGSSVYASFCGQLSSESKRIPNLIVNFEFMNVELLGTQT